MLTLFAPILLQATPAAPPVPPVETGLPFTYHERLVFLTVRVNDSERLFLLDTGASASAIDTRAADELALARSGTSTVEGTAGVLEVENARVASLSVGAHSRRDLVVTVRDLAGSLHPAETRLDGILGADFLAGFVLRLDFVESRLSLDTHSPPADGSALALELEHGIPSFPAQLDDLATSLRIDTGASLFASPDVYVNVPAGVWHELRSADPELAPAGQLSATGVGGTVALPVARIQALLVGATSIARPFVVVQPRAGYFARPDARGFVGNNFLEKFEQVTLDYPGRRLWLGPRDAER